MKKFFYCLLTVVLTAGVIAGCKKKDIDEPDPTPGTTPTPDVKKEVYEPSASPIPFSWVSVDDNNTEIDPDNSGYPLASKRVGKTVGIFYFLWHGCHGYDRGANNNQVVPPTAADTQSPYDIQKLLDANPSKPALGGGGVMHHWGQPYLDYYVMDDEWVIRKHAQMLHDAGVDVIIFDVTNGYHYLPIVMQIGDIYTKMRAEGNGTPQFAFLLNANPEGVFSTLWNELYSKGLYSDLWFKWEGKPLILMDIDAVTNMNKFDFTVRRSWFLWNNSGADTWFGDGVDKWPWGGLYPQQAGKHGGKNEYASVCVATHPTSNIGRSYDAKNNVQPSTSYKATGPYFKAQFDYANSKLNPKFMFFTGWNEWTAQKQIASQDGQAAFLGNTVHKGDWYFVDQYNHEFSRDIEPLNGDFGDNYYYMLANYVRKFKGTKNLPTFNTTDKISLGAVTEWKDVKAVYGDDRGDVTHRNHYGWGRLGTLTNNTGRNDIQIVKVTNDGTNVYFYAQCGADLTASDGKGWMQLFIGITGQKDNSWNNFQFCVNRVSPSADKAVLEKCGGGWKWTKTADVPYKVSANVIEIAIPLSALGIKDASAFSIDFKWVDNACLDGDIQTCMRDGDSAPNGRFKYRYKFKK